MVSGVGEEQDGGRRPSLLELAHVQTVQRDAAPTRTCGAARKGEKSQKPKAERVKMVNSISAAERTRRLEKCLKLTSGLPFIMVSNGKLLWEEHF